VTIKKLFIFYYIIVWRIMCAERIMRKVDEENTEKDCEGELVIGGRRLANFRYADDTTLLASTQEQAKKI